MKYILSILSACLILTSCTEPNPEENENEISTDVEEVVFNDSETIELTEDMNEVWEVSERFVSSGDIEMVFEHMNYQSYRIYEDGVLVEGGTMNTERGYMGDENATTYFLGMDLPMEDQRSIIRLSDSDTLKMYDSEAMLVEGVNFLKENP